MHGSGKSIQEKSRALRASPLARFAGAALDSFSSALSRRCTPPEKEAFSGEPSLVGWFDASFDEQDGVGDTRPATSTKAPSALRTISKIQESFIIELFDTLYKSTKSNAHNTIRRSI